jgi:hypothetical protein
VTQNERILEILSDGDWHEKSEFYGFCVLHSRISEIRHQLGIAIDKEHRGGKVYYRLGALEEGAADCLGPDGAPSSSASGVGQVLPSRRSAPQRQLQIWEAA